MDNDSWRKVSNRLSEHFEGSGYSSVQNSVRSRRPLTRQSKWNETSPQWDWSSVPAAVSEGGEDEPARELRNCTLPMSLKRSLRQVQKMRVPVVSSQESWRRKRAITLRRLRELVRQLLHFFTLWGRTLQKIGGNFGGGVQSFFLFLRFLVLLNFVTSLLIAGFILVPSIIFRSSSSSSASFLVNDTFNAPDLAECLKYDPNPPGLVAFYNYFLDLLSGTGFMEFTYLFYGFYNKTVVEDSAFSYSIPLAYIFTIAFYFVFCFIGIVMRMGATARVAVATGGSTVGSYSMTVFTGWDYGSMNQTATILKQKNIHYQLQVELEEQRLKEKAAALTLLQKVVLYSLRIFMFLLSLTLIGVALYCIYRASRFSQKNSNQEGFLGLIYEYLPSIVITAGNFLVPALGDQIALVERYSPSTTIILALLRSVVLRLVSLGVLLLTLWAQITCNNDIHDEKDCSLCQYNHELFPCWETRIGQEMYKLTLFDLLINVAVLVLVEFPRRILVDNVSNKLVQSFGRQEFVVPSNVLGLVYAQTVVWMGALFCPLLPLINVAKFIILFYIKKITLFNNCRPAQKTFRSTSSTFFFLVVLLCGWGLALAVMVYSMAEIRPSMSCGPFRGFPFMWSIVPNSFYNLPLTTQEFLFFIGSQAFSIPLFLLFSIMLCYFLALASVYGNSVALLKRQLKMEGRDKHFLVKQIGMLNKQVSEDSAEEEDDMS